MPRYAQGLKARQVIAQGEARCASPGTSVITYFPACRAGTPGRIDAVPALQAGEQFDGIYPGLRSSTRSNLGYNLAGFQPLESACGRHPDLILKNRSEIIGL